MATITRSVMSATVGPIDVLQPAVTVYTQGFNTLGTTDSWATSGITTVCSGGYGLSPIIEGAGQLLTGTGASGQVPVVRTITGLTIGLSYTFTAQVRWYGLGTVSNAKLGVTGLAFGTAQASLTSNSWYPLTYTFVATGTSHELRMEYTSGAATTSRMTWDDITLTRNAYLNPEDVALQVKEGSIALDESRVPYGTVELTVALPAEDLLEQITPYGDLRLTVTVDQEWVSPTRAPQTRTFDLLLGERQINHEDNTLNLSATTDEALLLDYLLIGDESERTYGLSVKDAVEYALDKVGAELESGAADANLESKALEATVTNLVVNPNARTALGNWIAGGANGTLTRQTGLTGSPVAGVTTYFRTTYTGSGDGGQYSRGDTTSPYIAVTAGQTYTLSAWVRASVAKSVRLSIQWANSGGTNIGSSNGASVTLVANTWTRLQDTFTAVAGAARAGVYTYPVPPAVFSSGNTYESLGWTMVSGSTRAPEDFDGATTDTGLYDYAWSGTANASASTRTNLANTDATIWEPGQSADNFLDPLLQATGLRLFCDEQRRWYLVEDAGYMVDGTVTVSEGFNAKSGTDLMSRQRSEDGRPLWFDSVVVEYRTPEGSRYDFAGAPGAKGFKVTYDRPYPGPGAAASILARAEGRGRVQDLVALLDLNATPGMALVSTMPGTPIQSGVVSSAIWYWSAEGDSDYMRIGSRGLTDTPDTAWILDAPGDSWDDIASGIDWSEDL